MFVRSSNRHNPIEHSELFLLLQAFRRRLFTMAGGHVIDRDFNVLDVRLYMVDRKLENKRIYNNSIGMDRLIPLDKFYRCLHGVQPTHQRIYDDDVPHNNNWNSTHYNKGMAEMALMKSLKLLLSVICYFGGSVAIVDEVTDGAIVQAVKPSPAAQEIIICLFIILLVLKIAWFTYEKFHLERKERNLKMDVTREEIEDMRSTKKKEVKPQQSTPS